MKSVILNCEGRLELTGFLTEIRSGGGEKGGGEGGEGVRIGGGVRGKGEGGGVTRLPVQLIIFLHCLKPSSAVLLAHFNTAPSVLSNNVL